MSHVEHQTHHFTPAERERLEERMWNWSRYMLDDPKTGGRRRCGSVEGRHVAPKEDDETGAERVARQTQEPIDILDAGRIEDSILRLKTQGQRQFLISWYCNRSRPEVMARRFRIPQIMLVPYLWAILGALQYRLNHTPIATRRASCYKASDNSTPAKAA